MQLKMQLKNLEIEPHNTEIKIFKKNVELIQRALSSSKLEKWSEAVRDFEIVHQALPYDKVIAKYLSQAQVALKQSRSEVVLNMESGGDLKEISSLEELKAALARPDNTEDNKNHDLDQEKLRSRNHFGWLRRIFSTSKPTSSPAPIPDPKKINSSGERMFNTWRYREALELYDRAIELSPKNVTYLSNRAAALSRWEEAVKLDPQSAKARHGLGMSLLRLGHIDEAMKLVEEASYNKYDLERVKRVNKNLNNFIFARRCGEWNNVLREISAPLIPGSLLPYAWPELAMCRGEALVKLSRVGEAHETALNAAALKVEPLPASFSQPQTRFFGMLCRAYAYFVKSQIHFALMAAENAAKALEIEPHNTEIKIFKKNVELVQRALSSSKLEKWAEAVRDYEILHQAMPYDKVIAKSLSQAQVALKQSRSGVGLNMESGGDVKEISSLEDYSVERKMFIKVKLPWNVMIPAEAMDPNGLMIQRAVLIRLLDAFASKKATKDLGYFIALKNLEEIGEGRIRETTGEIVFPVVFSGITFKMFKGEIVHGVVRQVHKSGVFLRCGPCENVYLSQYKMPGYDYIVEGNPLFMNQNMSRIQIGSTVRFIVLDIQWKEAEKEFIALASLEGNNLGPF
ncbi:hypothetical protein IGI04_003138 [Brassica rapa subsp. trilocularis]|uniref:S1 motif domain-containing protein n=1 Tax=Brassica rapa subsp. trilocularis TaxID=1813537 RepID=A0ABQ7NY90_BRACM|nr:hypothetical protein IGI04_003138 [Brassica rapa subsp. trilocularis]